MAILLDFWDEKWYNKRMKKTDINQEKTREMITISREEYETLQAQNERVTALEKQLELLTEALRLAKHKEFGKSSEKRNEELSEQLTFLFNEVEVIADIKTAENESVTVVTEHKRHKKHEYTLDKIPEGVPTETVEHRLSPDELQCPECGDTMTEIGKEVVRTLKLIPAKTIIKEDIYYTYACRKCNQNNTETPVVKTPKEKSIIPGSFATPEAIAHIMTQKFVMGSPLYRQGTELHRQGIELSRQTMSNWILKATEDYLAPVYEQMHKELLNEEVLHADETKLQVLNEPERKPQSDSFMWLYRTSRNAKHPIVLYEYQPGRKADFPKTFLRDFKGYLHTDGYSGYHNLHKEITVVGCWAHARRKFSDATKSLSKEKVKGSLAAQGLSYCNTLFEIEKILENETAKKRYEERLKQAKPVLDAFLSWTKSKPAVPKSAIGKALGYVKSQWPYLINYLKDGRLEISNNRAERSIKPFVIDRKNFLFANTPKGATGSAMMFSLIQTAIENQLDPYRYLKWLLENAKYADLTDPVVIQNLLPWNADSECRVR